MFDGFLKLTQNMENSNKEKLRTVWMNEWIIFYSFIHIFIYLFITFIYLI
jgi:hypothetical protein